jgi:hypothetical protein
MLVVRFPLGGDTTPPVALRLADGKVYRLVGPVVLHCFLAQQLQRRLASHSHTVSTTPK